MHDGYVRKRVAITDPLGKPDVYGRDRLFIYLRLSSAPDAAQDASVEELERAGHPVVRIAVDDPYDLGEGFFRWEFATAVAGSILGIHPLSAGRLTDEYQKAERCPGRRPSWNPAVHGREECGRTSKNGERHADAGRISRGASQPTERGRLFCASGVHRDE